MKQLANLLGFTPKEAADRALQAHFGILSFILSSAKEDKQLHDLLMATFESIEILHNWPQEEQVKRFERTKSEVIELLSAKQIPLFNSDFERIWKLFLEKYNIQTLQLRADIADVFECFNLSFLAKRTSRSKLYFRRLPLSTEIVLISISGGVKIEIYIPPRLLIMDMVLMLIHARREHQKIEKIADSQIANLFIEIHRDGRLDAYARQILILATTVCDNVLNEYGYLVEQLASNNGKIGVTKELKEIHRRGVTERLKQIPATWSSILNTELPDKSDVFEDMINLVQIRNRLVHPDGRVNCWHAFQLSPNTGTGWKFSDRIRQYISEPNYGIASSHIGYEYPLSEFCVNTTIDVINSLHKIIYPEDDHAIWLELPINKKNQLDIDRLIRDEKVLQL